MDFKIVGFFPVHICWAPVDKLSVGKIYYVICSILQAPLLMVYFLQIAVLRDFAVSFRWLFGKG